MNSSAVKFLSLTLLASSATALMPDGPMMGGQPFPGRGEPMGPRYGDMALQNDYYGIPSFGFEGGMGGAAGAAMPMPGGGFGGDFGMPSFQGPPPGEMRGMPSFGPMMGMMGGDEMMMPPRGMPSFGMQDFHRRRGGDFGGRGRGSMPVSAMGGARGVIPDEHRPDHIKNDLTRENGDSLSDAHLNESRRPRHHAMGSRGDFRGDFAGADGPERRFARNDAPMGGDNMSESFVGGQQRRRHGPIRPDGAQF
mmetsp:Transcript_76319/g.221548  ORF Transcript_76319/g.221548 Transcript_76319/m.221548 type:complete len:251 (-) Transcript_76319:287-1039(-)|eukprot:CAMPEP_0176016982 /NCGR_PEP_ID=MMETSP0120_2-20121206/8129_1 /TAXON_ID=160619 /ORGANISM="Kryptoperidinium foliaceum, Strain CCMP 1326" /LENGTH=250 /DNA_ID=CAMNT_0017349991 /DNA_START=160 /DNA_END=912 /DNA_ORIENTATION=+